MRHPSQPARTEAEQVSAALSLLTPGDDINITGTGAVASMDDHGRVFLSAPDGSVQVAHEGSWTTTPMGILLRVGDLLRVTPRGGACFEIPFSEPHIVKHLAHSDLPSEASSVLPELPLSDSCAERARYFVDIFAEDLVDLDDEVHPLNVAVQPHALTFPKADAILVVGCSRFADTIVAAPEVSRRHLEVRTAFPGTLEIRDISTLGTHRDDGSGSWLKLEPQSWVRIEEGSLLRLGGKGGPVIQLSSNDTDITGSATS